jgi:hypothetical protein
MDMDVQGRAEAMDEAHGPDPRAGTTRPRVAFQRLLDDADDEVEHRAEGGGLALEDLAQALGQGYDPFLTHGQAGKDVVDPERCGLRHSPGGAGQTEGAGATGESDRAASCSDRARPAPCTRLAALAGVIPPCVVAASSGFWTAAGIPPACWAR